MTLNYGYWITQREFIVKRIFFYKHEAKELKEGEDDDIFMYGTSCPTEFYPLNNKFERAENILGLMRIGKLPGGGTYFHSMD